MKQPVDYARHAEAERALSRVERQEGNLDRWLIGSLVAMVCVATGTLVGLLL